MNKETALISKIIKDRQLAQLFDVGVDATWFADTQDRNVWNLIHSHFSKYGECPSSEVIADNFPNYVVLDVQDNVDYLLDELLNARRRVAISKTMDGAVTALEEAKDYELALQIMQKGVVKLEEAGLSRSSDLEITANASKYWDDYLYRKANPGMLGVATGFPTIDEATNGLQNGQLIVIVAPPKTGKSTLALQIAQNVHMQGKTPMFQSFEMRNEEQLSRYIAMKARVSHNRYISGNLTKDEEGRVQAKLKAMEAMRDKFWLVGSEGSTVSAIAGKIQIHQPDIVFIDGTYLMQDEHGEAPNSSQAITNITRGLKSLALRVNKPIVISTQVLTNKMRNGQVTADAIGYSSSFHQDADVIFGLQREDDTVDDMRLLKVIASRNSGPSQVNMMWDWNSGVFREMNPSDYDA